VHQHATSSHHITSYYGGRSLATIEYIQYSPKRKDLTDQTFGTLTVLFYAYTKNSITCWYCVCACGRTNVIMSGNLLRGNTASCGKCHNWRWKHGLSHTSEYQSYENMISRCYISISAHDKRYYQDQGITVCDRWRNSFESFLEDIGYKPTTQHTIERRDNFLGYFKENCYWATRREQAVNRRSNVLVTFQDITQTLSQWEQQLGMKHGLLTARRRMNWSWERALTTPIQPYRTQKTLL
jgi:hypothetical protein